MRKLILAVALFVASSTAAPSAARADIGIGIFLFEPTGLDIKLGLGPRTGLDIVLGISDIRGDESYGHVTYLVTPFVARGSGVLVPFRIGIGAAVFGVAENDVGVALRVPFELGFRFRSVDLEIYFEITPRLVFVGDNGDPNRDNAFFDLDAGFGLRFYF